MSKFPDTEQGLADAGYKYQDTGKCRSCGEEIAWYETPNGKMMPLNEGTLEPHWATCPDANNWRKET